MKIVRCKSCQHRGSYKWWNNEKRKFLTAYYCKKGLPWNGDDWFCADGKEAEDELRGHDISAT